ncbi:MAG: neutral/alkaline non-lysosomal ceramidase N-terminal domain-containing protein [Thermoguttaceae bacterium]|nr:neutral/alkaline non-lysosomal ceramidase N-terminal domain-containing protein [Thermoguttaceae bacterium]
MKAIQRLVHRSLSRVVMLLVAIPACVFGTATLAQEAPVLQAGAAAVDISPQEFPVNMPGGFSANFAEGVHDPLHSRALVLSDGTTTLAMVVVDNLGVAREAGDEAKALAAERTGIAAKNILLAATHTHSAPASNVKDGAEPAVAYRKVLIDGIVESIVLAHQALRPAAVGHGAHPLPEEVFNRRWYLKPGKMQPNPFGEMDEVRMNPGTSPDVIDRPAAPTDPDVTILSVREAQSRKPLALFANYALHYVGATPRALVSADYFGEFARLMPSRLRAGEEFIAMMSNGASGDINNIPFLVTRPPREPFEQIRIVAGKAADAAWFAHAGIESHQADARLGMLEREVTLRMRRPTEEQIERAKAVLAVTDEAERAKLPRLAEAYARRTLSLAEADETLSVPVQAIRIGDLAVCALPFEVLVEIGLDLKQRSPFPRTMVLGVTNGYNGYLPPPNQHKLGGYETWMGTCRVEVDSSVILTDNLLEMLGELAKDKG